ncbi:MAG: hypothetical protein AAGE52_33050 [Myxococcota bacterium]
MTLQLPLKAVIHVLRGSLPRAQHESVDAALYRARFCDALRDRRMVVPSPQELDHAESSMDPASWRRLATVTSAIEDEAIGEAVSIAARLDEDPSRVWFEGFVGFAAGMDLHPLELLRESSHRLEEYARTWLLRVGVGVAGESSDQSIERLTRLDYARLLAEAERARDAATRRLSDLRRLQAKAERAR